ncbi:MULTISPECIES: hypothetical protein [unclassified Streptomyces]|uniref:hypothetical protein n=1 Tax=unclassified Streptomyces TaxID=2593676 RepID=UPI001F329722|nr:MULTISPECIES: hypothetical protein [unclassified Streptomyces]MCP3771317.1 hypothetical protein [Streptomyces sp. MAR25Y5]
MHLPAKAIPGDTTGRDIEATHNGGNGLDLVVTQLMGVTGLSVGWRHEVSLVADG